MKTLINNNTEYFNLYNDLLKYSTILLVVNLLMFLTNPLNNKFLGKTYLQFMTYILLGIITYWLVISKLILFD